MIYDNQSMIDEHGLTDYQNRLAESENSQRTAPCLSDWTECNYYLIADEITDVKSELKYGRKWDKQDLKEIAEETIDEKIFETLSGDEKGFEDLRKQLICYIYKKYTE